MEKQLDCRIPKSFFLIVMLFLSIKGRVNFLQLERFSGKCEQRFRYFFEQSFDFLTFNKTLITIHIKGKTALAFDPSFISKSGKKTPGVGYFWSGVAGKSKWGLEFCGLAVLDLTRKTAFHLFGFQTIDLQDDDTLISFYARKILEKKEDLLQQSKYLVADAYFSKITFVKPFVEAGFHIISRLRDDANLQYIFLGEQKKAKGRNRKYDGKIDFQKLDLKYLKLVSEIDGEKIYWLKSHHKSLKINVNTVIVYIQIQKTNGLTRFISRPTWSKIGKRYWNCIG